MKLDREHEALWGRRKFLIVKLREKAASLRQTVTSNESACIPTYEQSLSVTGPHCIYCLPNSPHCYLSYQADCQSRCPYRVLVALAVQL